MKNVELCRGGTTQHTESPVAEHLIGFETFLRRSLSDSPIGELYRSDPTEPA